MTTFAIETPPRKLLLSTVQRLQDQMTDTASLSSVLATQHLALASAVVKNKLGWSLARQELTESFRGHGFPLWHARMTPVAELVSADLDGSGLTVGTDILIQDGGAGAIMAPGGFSKTDKLAWSVRYWGGWLVPADDVLDATDVAFAASGQTMTRSSGSWPLLVDGDWIEVIGASNAANSGKFQVEARTSDSVLTLKAGSAIVDESAGASVSVIVKNLPAAIERATHLLAAESAANEPTDRTITKEKVGPVEISYGAASEDGSSGRIMREAQSLLALYQRL